MFQDYGYPHNLQIYCVINKLLEADYIFQQEILHSTTMNKLHHLHDQQYIFGLAIQVLGYCYSWNISKMCQCLKTLTILLLLLREGHKHPNFQPLSRSSTVCFCLSTYVYFSYLCLLF